MPKVKWLPPYAKKTEATKHVRPRLEIVEEILMLTAPKWTWKKFRPTMTLKEACDKVGISDFTLRIWRQENPKIGEYFNSVKAARKDMLHNMIATAALENVMEAIGWGVKLRPLDKANLSMRYLEKTDAEMNQSIKIDVENNSKPPTAMGTEEMTQRAMELAAALWITNLKIYAERTVHPAPSPASPPEESTWNPENEGTESVSWDGEPSPSEWAEKC